MISFLNISNASFIISLEVKSVKEQALAKPI
jgi:hypothetical protein